MSLRSAIYWRILAHVHVSTAAGRSATWIRRVNTRPWPARFLSSRSRLAFCIRSVLMTLVSTNFGAGSLRSLVFALSSIFSRFETRLTYPFPGILGSASWDVGRKRLGSRPLGPRVRGILPQASHNPVRAPAATPAVIYIFQKMLLNII